MTQFERVAGVSTIVGESPIWDAQTQSFWFIDIEAPAIHRLGPDDELTTWTTTVSPGAVAMMADGRVLVAFRDGLRILDPASGELGPLVPAGLSELEPICEGKADREGRMILGTRDESLKEARGRLIRIEHDGSMTTLREGIILSNGICFSVAGDEIYFADSFTGRMYAADYSDEGLANEREILSMPGEVYFPDGATVDAEGCVWVAVLHKPEVLRLAPDGTVVQRLEMPSPYLTSVAFGGPDLDVLYATSVNPARFPAGSPAVAPDFPGAEAGFLYRVTGLGVRGVAETPIAHWNALGRDGAGR